MKQNIRKNETCRSQKNHMPLGYDSRNFQNMIVMLAATNCASCLTYIISFDFHNNSVRQILLLSSFYR